MKIDELTTRCPGLSDEEAAALVRETLADIRAEKAWRVRAAHDAAYAYYVDHREPFEGLGIAFGSLRRRD